MLLTHWDAQWTSANKRKKLPFGIIHPKDTWCWPSAPALAVALVFLLLSILETQIAPPACCVASHSLPKINKRG